MVKTVRVVVAGVAVSNLQSSEHADLEELMARLQLMLGRVAALQSQLRDIGVDLTEFESGADELLQRLAEARRGHPGSGGV